MRHNRPPYKRITFAVVVTLLGCCMITIAVLLFVEHIDLGVCSLRSSTLHMKTLQRLYSFTPYGLLIFGCLCLIPGVYHIVYACRAVANNTGWEDWYSQ